MASNFIPMVSASPPPLDDDPSSYNSDEDNFGEFTYALESSPVGAVKLRASGRTSPGHDSTSVEVTRDASVGLDVDEHQTIRLQCLSAGVDTVENVPPAGLGGLQSLGEIECQVVVDSKVSRSHLSKRNEEVGECLKMSGKKFVNGESFRQNVWDSLNDAKSIDLQTIEFGDEKRNFNIVQKRLSNDTKISAAPYTETINGVGDMQPTQMYNVVNELCLQESTVKDHVQPIRNVITVHRKNESGAECGDARNVGGGSDDDNCNVSEDKGGDELISATMVDSDPEFISTEHKEKGDQGICNASDSHANEEDVLSDVEYDTGQPVNRKKCDLVGRDSSNYISSSLHALDERSHVNAELVGNSAIHLDIPKSSSVNIRGTHLTVDGFQYSESHSSQDTGLSEVNAIHSCASTDQNFASFDDVNLNQMVHDQKGGSWAPEPGLFNFEKENDCTDSVDIDEEDCFTDFEDFTASKSDTFGKDGNDVDDDEFGNFNSAQPLSLSLEIPVQSSAIEAILSASFVSSSKFCQEEMLILDDILVEKATNYSYSARSAVWANLIDFENTNALTYQWNHSLSSKRLLMALNIDTKNILMGNKWNPAMPAFAATLSFDPLEPLKPHQIFQTENDSFISNNMVRIQEINAQSQDVIPPAQFDWSTSGLVNPLDEPASLLLDLDFFLTNDVSATNISAAATVLSSLESELLTPDFSTGKFQKPVTVQVSPLVKKILDDARLTTTNISQHKSQNLSAEAMKMLDSLPDLSFMQAKVLMFPIRSPTL